MIWAYDHKKAISISRNIIPFFKIVDRNIGAILHFSFAFWLAREPSKGYAWIIAKSYRPEGQPLPTWDDFADKAHDYGVMA